MLISKKIPLAAPPKITFQMLPDESHATERTRRWRSRSTCNLRLTYGEYSKRRQALLVRNKVTEIWQRVRAQQQAQQQVEQAQQQAQRQAQLAQQAQENACRRQSTQSNAIELVAGFTPLPTIQLALPARPANTTTNCTWIGERFYCTAQ